MMTVLGEVIAEYLEVRGWSRHDLARRTGIAPNIISDICSGRLPVTVSIALAFEKALQRPAHFWLNLQNEFDADQPRKPIVGSPDAWRG